MSLDLEQRLRVFLASAPRSVWSISTIQISHSAMSRTFHLWREPRFGTTQAGGVTMNMEPCNFEVKLAGSDGNLDQRFDIRVDLVDIDDIFREQMDRIPIDTKEKISVIYREYMSDDLTAPQATAILQVESISYAIGAANISAVSPRLNVTRSGEIYSPRDVPMLRGF